MSEPTRLAVDPALVDAAGRRLRLLSEGVESTGRHFYGPQQVPQLGDPTCTQAYLGAHQQVAALVVAAVARNTRLATSTASAAALYAVLDGTGPAVGGETLAELGPPLVGPGTGVYGDAA